MQKRCSKCKRTQPVGEFYKCPSHRDNLTSHCRQCMGKQGCKYRQMGNCGMDKGPTGGKKQGKEMGKDLQGIVCTREKRFAKSGFLCAVSANLCVSKAVACVQGHGYLLTIKCLGHLAFNCIDHPFRGGFNPPFYQSLNSKI
jgi:hypothetical protein